MQRGAFLIPGLFVCTALGVVVSERLNAPPPLDRRVRVAYWEKRSGFEFDAMKRVVDAFNASQNRTQVDALSVSSIKDKKLMAVAGGIPPDVAGLSGPAVPQYANAIVPLDDYTRAAGISEAQYTPCFWERGIS